jgi:predicted anti-sigma-YlaC factor YlaD
MRPADPACERVARAFERLIDGDLTQGDPDIVEISREITALKEHLAACETCRALYALDLALIESIRTAPAVAFESVAEEVVREVRAKERRSLLLRWAPVVGVASWIGMIAALYGRSILERLLGLLAGGAESSPVLEGLSRAAGAALKLLGVAKSVVFDGALVSEASAYAPELAMGVVMAGALVIFMMYGMGIWLGKPREVRSWHRS